MKKFVLLVVMMALAVSGWSQEFERPVDYLEYLSKDQRTVAENLMRYISATVHSDNPAEVDRKRQELVNTIGNIRDYVAEAPSYEDSSSLKDAMLEYFTLNYQVMNDDYSKIVDMKKVAEESYDQMEAYIKAQDIANSKVDEAQDKLTEAVANFTSTHNIKLVQKEDKLSGMIKQANAVSSHYNLVYLIIFKTFRERINMQAAMKAKDVEAIERYRKLVSQYADTGIGALESLPDFNGDGALKAAATQRLKLYKEEAEVLGLAAIDLNSQQAELDELKEKLEAQKPTERTKEDVENHNKMVADINRSVNFFNQNSQKYNALAQETQAIWTDIVEQFRRRHIPKYGTGEQFS